VISLYAEYLSRMLPKSSTGVPIMSKQSKRPEAVLIILLSFGIFLFLKGYFFTLIRLMCSLSLISNALILKLFHTDVDIDRRIPKWVDTELWRAALAYSDPREICIESYLIRFVSAKGFQIYRLHYALTHITEVIGIFFIYDIYISLE